MAKRVDLRPHARRPLILPLAQALLCLAPLAVGSNAHALAFGPLRVLSTATQPLRAEVELLDAQALPISARALPPSELRDRSPDAVLPDDIKTEVVRLPDGRYILRLSSTRPISHATLKLALQVDDGEGVLARDFTLRLPAAGGAARDGAEPSAPDAAAPEPAARPRQRPSVRDVAVGEFALQSPPAPGAPTRRSAGTAVRAPSAERTDAPIAPRAQTRRAAPQASVAEQVTPPPPASRPPRRPRASTPLRARTAANAANKPRARVVARATPARQPGPRPPALPRDPAAVAAIAPRKPAPALPPTSIAPTRPQREEAPLAAASAAKPAGIAPVPAPASAPNATTTASQAAAPASAPLAASVTSAPVAAAAEPLTTASAAASQAMAAASESAPAPALAASEPALPVPITKAAPAARDVAPSGGLPWGWITPTIAAALLAGAWLVRRRRAGAAFGGSRDPLQPLQPGAAFQKQDAEPAPVLGRSGARRHDPSQRAAGAAAAVDEGAAAPSLDMPASLGLGQDGVEVIEHHTSPGIEPGTQQAPADQPASGALASAQPDAQLASATEFSDRLLHAHALLEQGRDQEAGDVAREILDVCDALEAELAALDKQIHKG